MITGYSDTPDDSTSDRCIDAFRYNEENLPRNEGWIAERAARFGGEGNGISRPINASSNICYRVGCLIDRWTTTRNVSNRDNDLSTCRSLLFEKRNQPPFPLPLHLLVSLEISSFPQKQRARCSDETGDAGNSVVVLHTLHGCVTFKCQARRSQAGHLPRPS